METSLVITIVGPDQPGLVESIAELIAARGGNWLDSRMAHLAGHFAGIIHAALPSDEVASLQSAAAEMAAKGVQVLITTSHGAAPVSGRLISLKLLCHDRPGLVRQVTEILSRHRVNIESFESRVTSAPMSGDAMFTAEASIHLAAETSEAALRRDLEALGHELMADLDFAPLG